MSLRLLVVASSSLFLVLSLSWCGTPAVCSGCMANGQCVPAPSAAQCGSDGLACVACAIGEACVAGACVREASDAGVDAGHDAGLDAGAPDAGAEDAGFDAGLDAGFDDAGLEDDGGVDAGRDAGADDAGADGGSEDAGFDAGTVQRVRLMAANLTAGNNQNYDVPSGDVAPGPGIRIMQGAHPDVIMLQEFRVGADTTAALQAMADSILGPGGHVCREPVATGDIPNGIISRFPIIACGSWQDSYVTNREYAWAHLDVPGPKDLWAISVHFLTNATSRPLEAAQVVQHVMNDIPPGDYVVLGGDFNTDTNMEPIFTTLAQAFVVQPQATDQFDNPGTNTNRNIRLADGGLDPQRNKPYDWVMPNQALMARMVPIVLTDGVTTFTQPHGFIIDTRVFDGGTIGLIAPALLGDSAAVNMQHMGVIRDFELPL